MRLLLIFSILSIQSAYALSNIYVGGDIKIPMRTDTSFTKGNIINHLELGTKVQLIKATNEGWSQIKYKEHTGWIVSRYLTNDVPAVEDLTKNIERQDRMIKSYKGEVKLYQGKLNAAEKKLSAQDFELSKFNSKTLELNKLSVRIEELSNDNNLLKEELLQSEKSNSSMHTTDFLTIVSTGTLFLGGLIGALTSRSKNREKGLYKL